MIFVKNWNATTSMKVMFKNSSKIVFDFITSFLTTSNFDCLNDLRIDFFIKFCFRIEIFMNVNCWKSRMTLIRRFFLINVTREYFLSIFSITYRELKFNVFRMNFFFPFSKFSTIKEKNLIWDAIDFNRLWMIWLF